MPNNSINIYDRIKESSYTIGTGNFALNGAVNGFSSFGSVYSHNDSVFYAATDGTFYEIGSGVYVTGVQNQLVRFPIKSTNSNNKVNFGEGIKEIFVTYPATHAVYIGSGINDNKVPSNSGVAIWLSNNIIGYDDKLVWDSTNSRLGINKTTPIYSIDVGGSAANSFIRSSGVMVGSSGVIFPSGNNGDSSYLGGKQLTHYEMNRLDQYAYDNNLINNLTGSSEVIELSGVASNYILFKKQNAGTVFAGPASGCTPPCSPDYPSFRQLTWEDLPKLPIRTITSSLDSGTDGEMCIDSSYLYIKSTLGWRRISLGGAF